MDLEVLITQKYFITSQGIDRMLMGLTGAIILKQTHVSNDYVGGVCNFHGSVLPQQKFGVMDTPVLQLGVTARLQLSFIWQAKENRSSRHEGSPAQKK